MQLRRVPSQGCGIHELKTSAEEDHSPLLGNLACCALGPWRFLRGPPLPHGLPPVLLLLPLQPAFPDLLLVLLQRLLLHVEEVDQQVSGEQLL